MLGLAKPRRLDEPIAVSLEDLVPQDTFYRHLEAKLDLAFVRNWAREVYAERGRPSIDPVIFFTLQLIMFFEGIRSERKLIETASLHLAHRWYLGHALDEPLPDHSSLTRIRQRLGVAIFERFFEKVVDLCQDAGLVWGRELSFNGTSVAPRFAVEAHLGVLFAAAEAEGPRDADAGEEGEGPTPLPVELTAEAQAALAEAAAGRHGWIGAAGRPDRTVIRGDYRRTADFRATTTNPDASLMPGRGGGLDLLYHDHYVMDGSRARIILAPLVTPAEVTENLPMPDLLWRVCFRWKLWPRQLTGDTTYGTTEIIVAVEDAGIRAYVPLPDFDGRKAFFGKGKVAYDAEYDAYRCPGGAWLRFRKHKHTERVRVYQEPAATCTACPLKTQCTDSVKGRQVKRSFDEAYLDQVRSYHATEAYAKAMRKRQVWVEPLFAEAKDWHGLRRFRLRGLEKVNMEALLIAAGQNLKRLLSWRGWRRRPFPSGAAGIVLPALPPLPVPVP